LTDIPDMLKQIISNIIIKNKFKLENIDFISVTITAELSDAFRTKREGISIILDALKIVFDDKKLVFIDNSGKFIKIQDARKDYTTVAAANWVSTALFLGQSVSKCILIDAGSTTIDIIPILNSLPVAKGNNDVSRMRNHELIYTGGLRATIPSITHFVLYKGRKIRISFEKFALISDVHRILNNISEDQYINDTADNRSKSIEGCYARLARIICLDIESITKEELYEIARYIYKEQLKLISDEISTFYDELIERLPEFKDNALFVITGLAAEFLIRKSLEYLGFDNIKYYEEITKVPDNISSSAFAVAGALYLQIGNKLN
ncbi:unnamed protein product, partial [marine sediment metagenome]